MSMFKPAAKLSDLEGGEIVPVEIDGVHMVLYDSGTGVRACQRYCLHQGSDLSEGLVSRGSLICAAHGWRFDADTGVHDKSAQTCLATYETRLEGEQILVNPTPIRRGEPPHDS